jgi:hypothetical protein
MGVMQFLAAGKDTVSLGADIDDRIVIEVAPRTFGSQIRLNEDALKNIVEDDDLLIRDDDDDVDGDDNESA